MPIGTGLVWRGQWMACLQRDVTDERRMDGMGRKKCLECLECLECQDTSVWIPSSEKIIHAKQIHLSYTSFVSQGLSRSLSLPQMQQMS
jgi:hypothetical protein